MDVYHIWRDLGDGVSDVEFSDHLRTYLGHLQTEGIIEGHRLTRRKLGLGPADLGEFHVTIEVRGLAQLDRAFQRAATRTGVVEGFHAAVNSRVRNFRAALYRDFPDAVRERGGQRF
jgi:hypothetical protein